MPHTYCFKQKKKQKQQSNDIYLCFWAFFFIKYKQSSSISQTDVQYKRDITPSLESFKLADK